MNKEIKLIVTQSKARLFRFLALFGSIFAIVATILNFIQGVDHPPFTKSLLYPYTNFLVPGINITCSILAIILFIFPHLYQLIILISFIEAAHLILTGFHIIGIFLYVEGIVFMFCFGFAQEHFKQKAIISVLFIFLLLLTLIPTWGPGEFFFTLSLTSFVITTYVVIYKTLSDKLNFLLGDYNVPVHSKAGIKLPEKGQTLNLKSLGLTERQISCIHYTIHTSLSYKEIASALITSESTVKKDMQDLFKLFGVKNREMFRILLIQYTLV